MAATAVNSANSWHDSGRPCVRTNVRSSLLQLLLLMLLLDACCVLGMLRLTDDDDDDADIMTTSPRDLASSHDRVTSSRDNTAKRRGPTTPDDV